MDFRTIVSYLAIFLVWCSKLFTYAIPRGFLFVRDVLMTLAYYALTVAGIVTFFCTLTYATGKILVCALGPENPLPRVFFGLSKLGRTVVELVKVGSTLLIHGRWQSLLDLVDEEPYESLKESIREIRSAIVALRPLMRPFYWSRWAFVVYAVNIAVIVVVIVWCIKDPQVYQRVVSSSFPPTTA